MTNKKKTGLEGKIDKIMEPVGVYTDSINNYETVLKAKQDILSLFKEIEAYKEVEESLKRQESLHE